MRKWDSIVLRKCYLSESQCRGLDHVTRACKYATDFSSSLVSRHATVNKSGPELFFPCREIAFPWPCWFNVPNKAIFCTLVHDSVLVLYFRVRCRHWIRDPNRESGEGRVFLFWSQISSCIRKFLQEVRIFFLKEVFFYAWWKLKKMFQVADRAKNVAKISCENTPRLS